MNLSKIILISLLVSVSSGQLLLPFSSRFGELLQKLKHLEDSAEPRQEVKFPEAIPPLHQKKSYPFSKNSGYKTVNTTPRVPSENQFPEHSVNKGYPGRRGPPPPKYLPKPIVFERLTTPPPPIRPFVGVRRTPYVPGNPRIPNQGIRGTKPRPKAPPAPVQVQKPNVASSVLSECKPGEKCKVRMRSFETDSVVLQYAYSHSSSLPPVVQAILDDTESGMLPPPLKWNQTISPEVVQFTMNLMKALRPNRALVVGVFTGLSVVGAATAINNRGLVIGVEYPQFLTYWKHVGNRYAQQADLMTKIQLRTEFPIPDSLDQLSKQEPGSFDFILLDDSAQENYLLDYERCLNLLRPGGVLLVNDFLVGGEVLSGPSLQSSAAKTVSQMNRKVESDVRVLGSFIPIGGGLIMVYKK